MSMLDFKNIPQDFQVNVEVDLKQQAIIKLIIVAVAIMLAFTLMQMAVKKLS